MATYYVDFANLTQQTWTMAVYQTLPASVGLDSVSWKQTTVPRSGLSGVKWDITYNVALADYQQIGGIGVYKASQTLPASLGTAWEIVYQDNVQQLLEVGPGTPGQILVTNNSGVIANPGIGMSGQGSVYKRGVVGGAAAQFLVTPTYWVGLFNQVQLGEVISSNVIVGPLQIQYTGNTNRATLTAQMVGQDIQLSIAYSQSVAVSSSKVAQLIAAQPPRPTALLG